MMKTDDWVMSGRLFLKVKTSGVQESFLTDTVFILVIDLSPWPTAQTGASLYP